MQAQRQQEELKRQQEERRKADEEKRRKEEEKRQDQVRKQQEEARNERDREKVRFYPIYFLRSPSRQGKTFRAPPFKEWKYFAAPFNMAKTSSYHVKTTPKLFPPPLFIGVKLHMRPPPLPFCSPPPLPVISDQSLIVSCVSIVRGLNR